MVSLIAENTKTVAELCRQHGVCRLEVFGSAARDEVGADSDLDFLVEFEPRTSGQFDAYFGLKEGLESLFCRPVDLVVTSAIRNPYFLESVSRHREVVYGTSTSVRPRHERIDTHLQSTSGTAGSTWL